MSDKRRQRPPPRSQCPSCRKRTVSSVDLKAALLTQEFSIAWACRTCGAVWGKSLHREDGA